MIDLSRHRTGAVIGALATPLIAGCFVYGAEKLRLSMARSISDIPAGDAAGPDWAATAAVLVGAVAIGLVAGSRVSPLASLIPGAVIGAVGLLWVFAPAWMDGRAREMIESERLLFDYQSLAASGTVLIVGIALLAASAPPSRWRAARPAEPAAKPADPREPGPDEDVLGRG
ncbi:hypothetical protein ACN3XK_55655 [Actinomadura welshii]